MAKRFLFLFFLIAGGLSACGTFTLTPIPTPSARPPQVWIVENAGKICFKEYNPSTHELEGVFRPKGCFSSSCTRWQEEKVEVNLAYDQMALKFATHFVVRDIATHTPDEQVCTADCEGGGAVKFKFTDVQTGTYTVWLGDQNMGKLEVPPSFSQTAGICFGDY